ncbi:MAG: amidohydrolase family protein, partial [Bacteroidota bacterium]
LNNYSEKKLSCSIVPHAPYSVSYELFHLISENAIRNNHALSIHMQENEEENLLFREKKGKILDRLKSFGINTNNFSATGKSSLESTLPQLPNENHLLLVHNTFTSAEEIIFTSNTKPNAFFCFCLRANHFIERKQPNLNLFSHLTDKICLGTDSYASNYSLNMLDEVNFALENSQFTLEQLIRFACINGSKALMIDKKFGSFEKGKSPGIVLISEEKNSKKLISKLLFS